MKPPSPQNIINHLQTAWFSIFMELVQPEGRRVEGMLWNKELIGTPNEGCMDLMW